LEAGTSNEITDWLAWFAGIDNRSAAAHIGLDRIPIDKTKYFDRLAGQINERQQKALLRMSGKGRKASKAG